MFLYSLLVLANLFPFITATVASGSWDFTNAPVTGWYSVASDKSGNTLFALSKQSGVWVSSTGGKSWVSAQLPTGGSISWRRLTVGGMTVLAGMDGGSLYASQNGGVFWKVATGVPTDAIWNGFSCSDSGKYCVAVVWNGGVYHSSDSGASWTLAKVKAHSDKELWSAVTMNSAGNVAYATIFGSCSTSKGLRGPGGETYPCENSSYEFNGPIVRSTDYGRTWKSVEGQLTVLADWTTIDCDATGDYVTAAFIGGIVYTIDKGNTWLTATTPDVSIASITSDASGRYVAAVAGCFDTYYAEWCQKLSSTQADQIYLSSDYGQTWTLSTAPDQASYTSIASNEDGSKLFAGVYNKGIIRGNLTLEST